MMNNKLVEFYFFHFCFCYIFFIDYFESVNHSLGNVYNFQWVCRGIIDNSACSSPIIVI